MSLEGLLTLIGIVIAVYALAQPIQRRSVPLFAPIWFVLFSIIISAGLLVWRYAVHTFSYKKQRQELMAWLEGWSLALDEMNYLKTGHRSGGLLDIYIVTDEDIAEKESCAMKIGAVTDAARPLPLMKPGQLS